MKYTIRRLVSLMLALIAVLSFSIPVFAEYDEEESQRASNYITSYYAYTSVSNGTVNVYFSITGTRPMDSIGATEIYVFNSHHSCVSYRHEGNTTGLMGSNTIYYSNTISCCSAESEESYFAIVYFKAEDSTGYDTASYCTL